MENKKDTSKEDKKEINFLKKCNQHIFIFKFTAILLVLFNLSMWGLKFLQSVNKYKNDKSVYDILSMAYESTEKFKAQDNFIFLKKFGLSKNTYYYKNGKFKEEFDLDYNAEFCPLSYGEERGEDLYIVNFWEHSKNVILDTRKKTTAKQYILEELDFLKKYIEKDRIEVEQYKMDEEKYNDKDCYVIEIYSDYGSGMFVIDKETMLVLRREEMISYDNAVCIDYEYGVGTTKDEDVKVKSFKGYIMDESMQNF